MWKLDESVVGVVSWCDDHGTWSIDARGGTRGVRLLADDLHLLQLAPTDDDRLPMIGEQFVRGDELHLWYPQADGAFSMRLALQPIASKASQLVLEATISIQTTLLDTHPTLDIVVESDSVNRVSNEQLGVEPQPSLSGGTEPITICTVDKRSVSILLGPHDSPFTSDRSTSDQMALRLFGDFLEKGVIRKARPWLVLDQGPACEEQLARCWNDLAQSPLPLTP